MNENSKPIVFINEGWFGGKPLQLVIIDSKKDSNSINMDKETFRELVSFIKTQNLIGINLIKECDYEN